MIRWSLAEVAQAIGGRVHAVRADQPIAGVATDSREVRGGELFFALSGEVTDGHRFVRNALRAGAVAAVVESAWAAALRGQASARERAWIVVDDTRAALHRLAAAYRATLRACVVAVVGSNGKTTTKAMIHHVLSPSLRGTASPASFNNHVGVPRTLLAAHAHDDYLIAEIGTNRPGEIATLARLVQPQVAVVTSIAEEHLEGLGDLSGVLDEESSIFEMMPREATAILCDEPAELHQRACARGLRVVVFGPAGGHYRVHGVRIVDRALHFAINGCDGFRLRVPAAHNARNAAAAAAVAGLFAIPLEQVAARLADFHPPAMRMEVFDRDGVTVIHDAYNANPASVRSALTTLAALPSAGRRIAVLGPMNELGSHSRALHTRVAGELVRSGVDVAIVVEPAATWMRPVLAHAAIECHVVADALEAGRRLAAIVRPADVVLLKASRAVGLERALETWTTAAVRGPVR